MTGRHFPPPSDTADEFRKQAEECRQLAATALKAIDKAFWLRSASYAGIWVTTFD